MVPQDPSDEPAYMLLRKLHKDQSEKIEFEIEGLPNGWVKTQLKNICSKITDGSHNSPPNSSVGDFPYITAKNIRPKKIDLAGITYVTKEDHKQIFARCNPEKGDVLYTKDGTIGYAAVNENDFEFSLLSSVSLLKPNTNIINPYYLENFLNSPATYRYVIKNTSGTALRRIILKRIKEIEILLPPLNEQKRIVKKIELLFSELDKIKTVLDATTKQLEQHRQSLLKSAFEGKLVPQDPSDEPAETLLQKIKQDKELLLQKQTSKRKKRNVK